MVFGYNEMSSNQLVQSANLRVMSCLGATQVSWRIERHQSLSKCRILFSYPGYGDSCNLKAQTSKAYLQILLNLKCCRIVCSWTGRSCPTRDQLQIIEKNEWTPTLWMQNSLRIYILCHRIINVVKFGNRDNNHIRPQAYGMKVCITLLLSCPALMLHQSCQQFASETPSHPLHPSECGTFRPRRLD